MPSDAFGDVRCDVLTFLKFSTCGERASDQYCSVVVEICDNALRIDQDRIDKPDFRK